MIYVYFDKLANIIAQANIAQDNLQKSQIKSMLFSHRHQILSQFCSQNHLPVPVYAKQSHGKPVVTNSPLAFNQSHSDDDYALVYSLSVQRLGVDIEGVHRQANFEPLARRFFHADEYALWQASGCDRVLWFKIWTIKEAVLKASGLGIRMPLRELNAQFASERQGEVVHEKIGRYRFECVMVGECVLTVAYEGCVQAWQFVK
ncbi:4'-phosphopantetheinyl transferase superfamily protein [Moraxella nasibovis]|uniref:4'-phosphopantetheinyl transferase family protein n=1 Tax=Moraxella nasibovis TaxID=2904120 RepID=UPI0024106911|nr:4'-phosphopantetheinyl transferase superfamily protein [Moraxella nasibovis]WFF39518.1 4'-phosphopantetheinyl transferase superfamily protein [Moraxella nasibovis]